MAKSCAKCIIGETANTINGVYHCEFNKRDINLRKFDEWIQSKVSYDTLMYTRSLPIIVRNHVAVRLIANGHDIWADDASHVLTDFRNQFLQ